MPIIILGYLLLNFLNIASFALYIFLLREWYIHKGLADSLSQNFAKGCLIGAILLFCYSFLGRYLIRIILSKSLDRGNPPQLRRYGKQQRILRPDGSIINIEHGGQKSKPAIIFLHGWNSNSMQWFYQKQFFEKDFHLIFMDQAGLGKSSSADNHDYSLEKLAGDLNAVILQSGAKKPVLWGHSMGGFCILTYLKLNFQSILNIKGIILEHTTYTNPIKTSMMSSVLQRLETPLIKPLCWVMIVLSPAIWLSRWMSYLNGASLVITRFLTFSGKQSSRQLDFAAFLFSMTSPAVTGRGVLAMLKYEVSSSLSEIKVPTLIIGADKDRLTKHQASSFMNRKIPGSKLYTLVDAGHMGFLEQHQKVNERVKQFLNGN